MVEMAVVMFGLPSGGAGPGPAIEKLREVVDVTPVDADMLVSK